MPVLIASASPSTSAQAPRYSERMVSVDIDREFSLAAHFPAAAPRRPRPPRARHNPDSETAPRIDRPAAADWWPAANAHRRTTPPPTADRAAEKRETAPHRRPVTGFAASVPSVLVSRSPLRQIFQRRATGLELHDPPGRAGEAPSDQDRAPSSKPVLTTDDLPVPDEPSTAKKRVAASRSTMPLMQSSRPKNRSLSSRRNAAQTRIGQTAEDESRHQGCNPPRTPRMRRARSPS